MSNLDLENGRMRLAGLPQGNQFDLYDKIPAKSNDFLDAMNGNFYDTVLSKAFFSSENQDIIQNGIRAGVYKLSKGEYIIAPQCTDTIKVIMRSIFLQYSANMNTDITKQIYELNGLVIHYCTEKVYNETKGYLKYLHDVSTMHVPIDHPTQSGCYNKSLKPNPFV